MSPWSWMGSWSALLWISRGASPRWPAMALRVLAWRRLCLLCDSSRRSLCLTLQPSRVSTAGLQLLHGAMPYLYAGISVPVFLYLGCVTSSAVPDVLPIKHSGRSTVHLDPCQKDDVALTGCCEVARAKWQQSESQYMTEGRARLRSPRDRSARCLRQRSPLPSGAQDWTACRAGWRARGVSARHARTGRAAALRSGSGAG